MKLVCVPVYYATTNCYIICDEKEKLCAVIDPGGDADVISNAIGECGCALTAVFLTHGHYDHTGALKGLRESFGNVPVYLNERDVIRSEDAKTRFCFREVGETLNYDEGDVLRIGDISVNVIATPGHTPGGVCLIAGDAIFCGDTLFKSSMGRTDLPFGSEEDMMNSLSRIGNLEGNYKLYPGHMAQTELDIERTENAFMRKAMKINTED